MAIEELIRLIRPPKHPLYVDPPVKWEIGKAGTGPDLPREWLCYASTYGSGSFVSRSIYDENPADTDIVFRFILPIFNPYSPFFRARIDGEIVRLQEARKSAGEKGEPYPIFPEEGGLLPLGIDDNDTRLFWLTRGEPDQWPIVLRWGWGRDEHLEVRMPLTEFLMKLLTCEVQFPPYSDSWSVDQIAFEAHDL